MEKFKQCNSCQTRLTNLSGSTTFKCPSCSKQEIVRCKHCREIGAKYLCSECSFSGPN
ncbi:RNA-binding protein [Candidatus Woesearchaeota archaeon]|nr:RNA-binding protein [Candidatus Woesearchaeota archaeon]